MRRFRRIPLGRRTARPANDRRRVLGHCGLGFGFRRFRARVRFPDRLARRRRGGRRRFFFVPGRSPGGSCLRFRLPGFLLSRSALTRSAALLLGFMHAGLRRRCGGAGFSGGGGALRFLGSGDAVLAAAFFAARLGCTAGVASPGPPDFLARVRCVSGVLPDAEASSGAGEAVFFPPFAFDFATGGVATAASSVFGSPVAAVEPCFGAPVASWVAGPPLLLPFARAALRSAAACFFFFSLFSRTAVRCAAGAFFSFCFSAARSLRSAFF